MSNLETMPIKECAELFKSQGKIISQETTHDDSHVINETVTTTFYQLPSGEKCKITKTKFSGPKSAIERMSWKPFGSVTKDNSMDYTQTSDELVYLETTHTESTPKIAETPKSCKKMGIRARFKQQAQNINISEQEQPKTGFASRFRDALKQDRKENDENFRTIFLCNVPTYFDESDLRSLLADTDFKILRVNMVKKPKYPGGPVVPNGNAFIVCETVEETQNCIEMLDGARWDTCILSAQLAQPK
jgi:hypothetical protein